MIERGSGLAIGNCASRVDSDYLATTQRRRAGWIVNARFSFQFSVFARDRALLFRTLSVGGYAESVSGFAADKAVDKYRAVYREIVHRGPGNGRNATETSHAKYSFVRLDRTPSTRSYRLDGIASKYGHADRRTRAVSSFA